MKCKICGAELQPGQTICPHCATTLKTAYFQNKSEEHTSDSTSQHFHSGKSEDNKPDQHNQPYSQSPELHNEKSATQSTYDDWDRDEEEEKHNMRNLKLFCGFSIVAIILWICFLGWEIGHSLILQPAETAWNFQNIFFTLFSILPVSIAMGASMIIGERKQGIFWVICPSVIAITIVFIFGILGSGDALQITPAILLLFFLVFFILFLRKRLYGWSSYQILQYNDNSKSNLKFYITFGVIAIIVIAVMIPYINVQNEKGKERKQWLERYERGESDVVEVENPYVSASASRYIDEMIASINKSLPMTQNGMTMHKLENDFDKRELALNFTVNVEADLLYDKAEKDGKAILKGVVKSFDSVKRRRKSLLQYLIENNYSIEYTLSSSSGDTPITIKLDHSEIKDLVK